MAETADKTISEDSTSGDLNFSDGNSFFIYGYFDDSIATKIVPALIKEIKQQKALKNGVIKFYIDSNGGQARYLFNLLALIEDAKKAGVVIETYVFGYAYSCGSLLACAGTKGKRYISYLAEHLCHLGMAGTGGVINDKELERAAARSKNHFDTVRNLYRKYANLINLEEEITADNHFLRGVDIINNGLADAFVD